MMKKLVFGLAICSCAIANGLDVENLQASKISGLVSSVAAHPEDSAELRELVEILSDSEEGSKSSEIAVECCNDLSISSDTIEFEQIVSMLQAIRRDWNEYGYSMSVDYYIKGAFSGKFGPYNIPDEIECY